MAPRLLLLLIISMVIRVEVQAQATGGDSPNTLLPEINPQDIEIRSEFRARFPGLRRQPILGFNPKPRVFQINPNRMPFMETKEEAVANVAITELDRPEPPARSVLPTPSRTNALLKAGFGTYFSPELQGYFYHGFNEKSALSGNLDYRSSDGHLDNQLSGFRFFDGDIRFTTKTNNGLQINTGVGFLSDFNRMYDIDPIYQDPINDFSETALKTYSGGSFSVSAEKKENAFKGWKAGLSASTYSTDLEAGTTDFSGNAVENMLTVDFALFWPGKRLYETFTVDGDIQIGQNDFPQNINSTGGYATNSPQSWLLTTAGISYGKMLNFSTHVSARAALAYADDNIDSKVYLAPELNISYNLKDAITLDGSIYGKPGIKTLQGHQQTNRFLVTETQLQHSYTSGAMAEINLQVLEGNRVYGGLSYEIIKNYAFYDRITDTVVGTDYQTFYGLNFDKANIFEIYGGITQQLNPNKFWFDTRVYVRSPKLDGGDDIPFEERLGITGSLSYLPMDKLKVTSWASYTGPRQAPASNRELDGFVLLNAGAEYQFTSQLGGYVKVLNMLGQKYELWDGYQERPFQAFLGLILKL